MSLLIFILYFLRLSSSSASSTPTSNAGGNLVDKTTLTTFKTPTGVARRSMSSSGTMGSSMSSKSASSFSSTASKASPNVLFNGSPNNSDSEGEDSKDQGKEDSDDDDKGGRSSPTANTRQSKRKRGRPPKDKQGGGKSDQGNGSGGKNSKSSNGTDPYDFDDDGNDPSGSAGENNASGDEKIFESAKKNEWRVDESGNLMQLNDMVTKSEIDMEEGQEGSEMISKEVMEKVSGF